MTVIYIKDAKSKGYLRVGVESDGEKLDFNVSEAEYRMAGAPLVRDSVTRDSLDILYKADMRYRARIKALNILSYGDNSARMLTRKLSGAKISPEIVDEVVREMVSRGYINTDRQLEKLILKEVNLHNFGPLKIVPKLIGKGYSKSDVTRVIEELEDRGEIDFNEAKKRLLKSKLCDDSSDVEKKKILYKNGYYVC